MSLEDEIAEGDTKEVDLEKYSSKKHKSRHKKTISNI